MCSSCVADLEALGQRLVDALTDRERVLLVREAAAEQRELVAAEARRQVLRARGRLQALADGREQAVADLVAERVVDVLEAVEVQEEHRDRAGALVLVRALERLVQRGQVEPPVGETGERVVHRAVPQGPREEADEHAGGERRADREHPARDLLLPDAALHDEDEAERDAHQRGLPERLAQREERERVDGGPEVEEDVGAAVLVVGEDRTGDDDRRGGDRRLEHEHGQPVEPDDQHDADEIGADGHDDDAGLRGLRAVRELQPDDRERRPGEEQEGERPRDQRAVVGGVLRCRIDGTADPQPRCEPVGNRDVPSVALKGPLGHQGRIGRGEDVP